MSQRYCRKCLLDEVFEEDEYNNMQDYIRNLDKHIKTEANDYTRRLGICKQCDNLINGMCKICGCFVEMRAAVKKNYCPSIERYW